MIKAEYDLKNHCQVCEIHCHCSEELKADLLRIITQCFKSAPGDTIDVIEDFMNILKESMQHDS